MDNKMPWLPLLLLVIAATAGTTNGKYTSTMVRDVVRNKIMNNKRFPCYPKIQKSFSQYAVMMILPEPPFSTWSAFSLIPSAGSVNNINNQYVVSPKRSTAINYMVSRSWYFYDFRGKQVRDAEPELLKRMDSLLQNWLHRFPHTKEYPTILLYTKRTPCSGCTQKIINYRNEYSNYPFILAWTDEIGGPRDYPQNDNNRKRMSKAGIYVVRVSEPPNVNIRAGCRNYQNTKAFGQRIAI